ncbi:hypothetical protein [Terriglobus sp.]|uniref:hypothetical protein n=1 Tax=Terriglobus sp. TaxID=1889013 RepID=UPI003AFFF98E
MAAQHTGASPERVTQGFVANLTWAWRHPSLSLLEIGWRWLYGAPALWLVWGVWQGGLAAVPWQSTGVQRVTANQLLTDPMGAALAFSQFVQMVVPQLLGPARWLAPVLLVSWIAVSSVGRTLVLRRMDHALRPRMGTMFALQAVRVAVSAAVALLWWFGVRWLAGATIAGPIAAGRDPEIMAYTGGAIALTLGLFVLAGAISWVFAAAPIVAMRDQVGVLRSLGGAARAHGARAGMAEINLVLSVVKIMLIVLAMAFSAFPLPFTTIETEQYVLIWTALVGLWYFAASDFFHVTRLHAFTQLLRRRELTQAAVAASE